MKLRYNSGFWFEDIIDHKVNGMNQHSKEFEKWAEAWDKIIDSYSDDKEYDSFLMTEEGYERAEYKKL